MGWRGNRSVFLPLPLTVLLLGTLGVAGPALGTQFQVNSYTTDRQFCPSVSVDASGNFVVVWWSYGSPGNDSDGPSSQGQRYDSAGATLGAQFQVNSYTTGYQEDPVVSVDSNGDFVVVWWSLGSPGNDDDSWSVQGQRYDSTGTPAGSQFQVNTFTDSGQVSADVSVGGHGDFVVVWTSDGSAGSDTSSTSIQGQRYDSTGATLGSEFQVNTYTLFPQSYPSVSVDAYGDFVVAWSSYGSVGNDNTSSSIQGQRYDSTGATLGSQFQVNTYTTSNQTYPSVSVDADGDFVIVWSSEGSAGDDNDSYSIQGQRYDSTGAAMGSEFQVNTYTTSYQAHPAASLDADGDFVVTWMSYGSPGNDTAASSIQAQHYDSNGTQVGSQFQVNSYTTSYQYEAAISLAPDGDFVVVWRSYGSVGTDTDQNSVQARQFSQPEVVAVPALRWRGLLGFTALLAASGILLLRGLRLSSA